MVSNDEQEMIIQAAADQHNTTISFLQEMVQTPSVNPPGDYDAIHSLVTDHFESFGWDIRIERTPDKVLEDLGLDPNYPRPNILSYVTRSDGPTIALNAHLDTVPIPESEEWEHDPFGGEIDGDRLYGRGANDSKGRIAAYTAAARVLEETDLIPENATIVLAITCDEETGGEAGPGYLIESGILDADYAIVEGNCENITLGASGVRHFQVTVNGQASHAGMNPEGGVNAILGAKRILDAIETYSSKLTKEESGVNGIDYPTCIPGTITGGIKTNVVPSQCSFTVDHRVPPDYDGNDLERRFKNVITNVSVPEGISVDVEITLRANPYLSEPNEIHVQAMKQNAEAMFNHEFDLVGIRGFSDGRFFASGGAKTLNFGPGDSESNPHGADENISTTQVRNAGATVAASILDIARF